MATKSKRGTRATKSTGKSGVKSLKPKSMNSKQANRVKGGGSTFVTTSALSSLIDNGWNYKENKKN